MPRGWLWLVCLLIVLLAAPARGAGSPLKEAKALSQQVPRLYQAGRYQEALPLAFRSLNELEFNLWWKLDKTLADRYSNAQKAEILAALQQAQCEEALHLLRYDTEGVGLQAVSLGRMLSVKLDPGQNPPRHSQRGMDILRPLLKRRAVARFR